MQLVLYIDDEDKKYTQLFSTNKKKSAVVSPRLRITLTAIVYTKVVNKERKLLRCLKKKEKKRETQPPF